MTRKLPSILLFFAHLAILPGCQSFPYFGSSAKSPDYRPHLDNSDWERNQSLQQQAISTASARDDDRSAASKLPDSVAYQVGSVSPVGDIKKKRPEGSTGIVEMEPTLRPAAPEFQIVQTPQPLPLLEKKQDFEPIVLALQLMLEGRHQEAIKVLGAYDGDKQELLLRLLPPLTVLVKKRMEDLTTQDVANLIKQFDSLRDELRPRSELIVSRMCYCKEVHGFAYYEALADNHAFLASTPDRVGEQVQLYVELKNFSSEPTKEGDFVTKLSCSIELRDVTTKKIVWSKPCERDETTLRRSSRLNDLYSRYGFYVPILPPGQYQLTLHVSDQTNAKAAPRVASKSLEFRVTPVANQTSPR